MVVEYKRNNPLRTTPGRPFETMKCLPKYTCQGKGNRERSFTTPSRYTRYVKSRIYADSNRVFFIQIHRT
jgi:hypothetical protein